MGIQMEYFQCIIGTDILALLNTSGYLSNISEDYVRNHLVIELAYGI